MSKVIGIMGESGSGKTTSMRNLDPKTTFYIDCDKKGLSWKEWRKQYMSGWKHKIRQMKLWNKTDRLPTECVVAFFAL